MKDEEPARGEQREGPEAQGRANLLRQEGDRAWRSCPEAGEQSRVRGGQWGEMGAPIRKGGSCPWRGSHGGLPGGGRSELRPAG